MLERFGMSKICMISVNDIVLLSALFQCTVLGVLNDSFTTTVSNYWLMGSCIRENYKEKRRAGKRTFQRFSSPKKLREKKEQDK